MASPTPLQSNQPSKQMEDSKMEKKKGKKRKEKKKKGKMVVGGEHDFSQPLTNPSPLYFSFLFFH